MSERHARPLVAGQNARLHAELDSLQQPSVLQDPAHELSQAVVVFDHDDLRSHAPRMSPGQVRLPGLMAWLPVLQSGQSSGW